MTGSKTYGIGILGLGVMGRRMVTAMRGNPRFRIVGVYDPRSATDGFQRANSAEALAKDPNVDCLYIASPPAHHAAGVALAVSVRKPVLCEKPLAPTVEEAAAMCAQVKASGKPSAVNFSLATGTRRGAHAPPGCG
jgi:predicted dehydrogenase